MKRILYSLLVLSLVSSMLCGCDSGNEKALKVDSADLDLGSVVSEISGNTNKTELKYADADEMVGFMSLACENEKLALYYSPDNMAVALKDKQSGKTMLSNPYNAATDENYSGVVGQKLDSQVVISYLEKETKIVDMYSSAECAEKGQYSIKTYDNGLSFDLLFGTDADSLANTPKVFSKERYDEIYKKVSDDSKEMLETYYAFYKKSDLSDSGIYDLYPQIKSQDLYFCDLELSERDQRKLSLVFEEAGYTTEQAANDAEALELGQSAASEPFFKITVEYLLTDTGVTVAIPNKSIEYNPDFPLLKVSVLPYFGADEASPDATGYLFVPDGSGTVINMNQNEPNRRTIMTGKVYGENTSKLPKKTAVERVEQYYLPVFGTVRNNQSALFGIITSGDGNCQITSLLGRPNGNYYTVNPEFIVTDYEQYTRISVVSNAWSNKMLYLYDKNSTKDDFRVQYYFLTDDRANYSAMAAVYKKYIFGDRESASGKPVINISTVGSALVSDSFLGFTYDAEAVFTGYEDNIKIIEELSKNKAGSVSLMLQGWQKDGLDAAVSNKLRFSSDLGGKKGFKELSEYCKDNNISLSISNNISFVGFDKTFDGFRPKKDAARTLELKYAKNSKLSPDTMLYDDGDYIVKANAYNKYLSNLVKSADDFSSVNLNLGALGYSLNSDYAKKAGINRGDALRYVLSALENQKDSNLSFDKGNGYVLPYAKAINGISTDNSGLPGETAAVPFMQMVLGGIVSNNSEPVNLKEDIRAELLKCIESGTVPTYLISYKNTSGFKNTKYTDYYSVDYEILKSSILDSYGYISKVVTATGGSSVAGHSIIAEGVTVSVYENGTKVYVNKTDKDYEVDGITVNANDYKVVG